MDKGAQTYPFEAVSFALAASPLSLLLLACLRMDVSYVITQMSEGAGGGGVWAPPPFGLSVIRMTTVVVSVVSIS